MAGRAAAGAVTCGAPVARGAPGRCRVGEAAKTRRCGDGMWSSVPERWPAGRAWHVAQLVDRVWLNAQETPARRWHVAHDPERWPAGRVWQVAHELEFGCVNAHVTPARRWQVAQLPER